MTRIQKPLISIFGNRYGILSGVLCLVMSLYSGILRGQPVVENNNSLDKVMHSILPRIDSLSQFTTHPIPFGEKGYLLAVGLSGQSRLSVNVLSTQNDTLCFVPQLLNKTPVFLGIMKYKETPVLIYQMMSATCEGVQEIINNTRRLFLSQSVISAEFWLEDEQIILDHYILSSDQMPELKEKNYENVVAVLDSNRISISCKEYAFKDITLTTKIDNLLNITDIGYINRIEPNSLGNTYVVSVYESGTFIQWLQYPQDEIDMYRNDALAFAKRVGGVINSNGKKYLLMGPDVDRLFIDTGNVKRIIVNICPDDELSATSDVCFDLSCILYYDGETVKLHSIW